MRISYILWEPIESRYSNPGPPSWSTLETYARVNFQSIANKTGANQTEREHIRLLDGTNSLLCETSSPSQSYDTFDTFRYSYADKPNGASMNRRNKARFNLGWNSSNALSKVLRRGGSLHAAAIPLRRNFPSPPQTEMGWARESVEIWKILLSSFDFFLYRGFVVIVGGKNVIFFSLSLSLCALFLFLGRGGGDWALLMNERNMDTRNKGKKRFNFLLFEILFFHHWKLFFLARRRFNFFSFNK